MIAISFWRFSGLEQLEAYYGLPKEVIYCKRCVISNQRPNSTVEMKNKSNRKETIKFSEDNICSACQYNQTKREINWEEREKKLFDLLSAFRSKDGSYDVLVPSSGGKDSCLTAHVLKYKYKMNPLAVTWAPNMFTKAGWNNFNNLSKVGGIDSLLYTPNGKLHSHLTKLAFENLGHPFQPFVHGQKVIGPKLARKMGIKLIMYGENQAEYGNPMEDNENPFMSPTFFSIEDPTEMILGGIKIKDLIKEYNYTLEDFSAYIPITPYEIENFDIKVSFLGFFEKWDPQESYYYAVENTGFRPSDERSEGTYSRYTEIDDKVVPLHFYMTFIKFGIGRATYDASQEIRNGKITREEGIKLVKKYDSEFPQKYFNEMLEYMDISEKYFWEIVNLARSPHLWKYKDGEWIQRHTVWMSI